jgi:energy-coupling factor transporter ATP-binding protein EcfA2
MNNNFEKTISMNQVFEGYYLNAKIVFMHNFNTIPSVSYVGRIDGEKAFGAVMERHSAFVRSVHQHRDFETKQKTQFGLTVVVLQNNCVLEFDDSYCRILHVYGMDAFVKEIVGLVLPFKERPRRKPHEINLIVRSGNYLELKSMEIKKTKLDIDLFYEDDLKAVDEVIRKRLNNRRDKGIVLLHGLPGTGKTTYLRYLSGMIKKKIMFLPPNIAGSLVDPEFVELIVDNPESVLIIEDAENIIMDRRTNSNSAVSNLLNISDGLLADFLNAQLICTFNSSLTMVDNALLRKGRLIAKYEFGKLSVAKAQRLSDHLGFKTIIRRPMTVAEITNQDERDFETRQVESIGFRRNFVESN